MSTATASPWQEHFAGKRHGVAHGYPVRILTVSGAGVRCRFPDGHVERVHPDDVEVSG